MGLGSELQPIRFHGWPWLLSRTEAATTLAVRTGPDPEPSSLGIRVHVSQGIYGRGCDTTAYPRSQGLGFKSGLGCPWNETEQSSCTEQRLVVFGGKSPYLHI